MCLNEPHTNVLFYFPTTDEKTFARTLENNDNSVIMSGASIIVNLFI